MRDPGPLVLALNPSVDVEWRVQDVIWEEKNTLQSERRWAGGKGVNVARWLRHLGMAPRLVLPLGGRPGREMSRCLHGEGIRFHRVALDQDTRTNIIVTTDRGRQLRFNPRGPALTHGHWRRLKERTQKHLARTRVIILSGSLPRGLGSGAYAELIRLANRMGTRTLLDCDGAPFAAAIRARPFLVKPNEHELAQWWGKALNQEAEVIRAIRSLSRHTRAWVLLSRGSRGGCLINEPTGQYWHGTVPRQPSVNTIGAGDALLAAVAWQIHRDATPDQWLRWGLAAGTAATRQPAGHVAGQSEIARIAQAVRLGQT